MTVEGDVTEPGIYPYIQGMRLDQLLYLAKNLRKDAYTPRADLYRYLPDNSVQIIPINLKNTLSGAICDDNLLLQPRDRLVVALQKKNRRSPWSRSMGLSAPRFR